MRSQRMSVAEQIKKADQVAPANIFVKDAILTHDFQQFIHVDSMSSAAAIAQQRSGCRSAHHNQPFVEITQLGKIGCTGVVSEAG